MKSMKRITGKELKFWIDFLNVDNIMLYDSDMNNICWLFVLMEEDKNLDIISDNKTYYIES